MTARIGPVAIALLVVAALAGCRERPDGKDPVAAEVASAVPRIEKAVGVPFKQPPKFEERSRDSVRAYLVREFDRQEPQRELEGSEAAYKALGLIPDTMNLRRFLLDVLTEQVIGYYDPGTKVLYVVQGVPKDVVGLTITHELIHALQDQYFPLDSLQRIEGDDDRQAAAQAVIEGQANYESLVIAAGGSANIASRLPGGWDQLRDLIRDNMTGQPIFASAPTVIQETLLFPYINGAEFVRRYKQHDADRMPFDDLPVSTEQIMHEEAYFGATRDEPTTVVLPPVSGAIYDNVLGEFGMRLFLFQHLQDQNAAIRGATGWDGDRYVAFRTSGGTGIASASVWDGPIDAAEFVTTLTDAMSARYKSPASTEAGARVINGRGRTVRITQREIGGRNVVLFVDVPAGAPANVLDLARVRLGS